MAHVTYIIGAGASLGALPLNTDLLSRIKEAILEGEKFIDKIQNESYFNLFRRTYIELIEEIEQEFSIDTLALANLENAEKLHYIKVLLWLYFSGQAGRKKLDRRYKPLLLKLRDRSSRSFRLRQDVSFLSWNYDLQIEETFANLSNSDLWRVPNILYTYPSIEFVNPGALDKRSSPDIFQLMHLNGSAGFYYDQERRTYDNWYGFDFKEQSEFEKIVEFVIRKFHTNNSYRNALKKCINFADEDLKDNNQKAFYLGKIAEKTTHLVSIGYSFPDYNRRTDAAIIQEMKSLEYIYIQDKKADDVERKLLSRYPMIKSKKGNGSLLLFKDYECTEFHLPPPID